MLLLPRAVRILLAAERIDMRNSIDGLCAIIRNQWKESLYPGHLFVFVSKRGDRAKVLTWDNGGFVITYKRLEQGRFQMPVIREGLQGAVLDTTSLAMLLDGIDLSHVRRPKKWGPPEEPPSQTSQNLINPEAWQRSERRTRASGGTRRSGSPPRTPSSTSASSNSSATSSAAAVCWRSPRTAEIGSSDRHRTAPGSASPEQTEDPGPFEVGQAFLAFCWTRASYATRRRKLSPSMVMSSAGWMTRSMRATAQAALGKIPGRPSHSRRRQR